MRGLRTFLTFVIVLGVIGGGSWAVWEYVVKDKVNDKTPEERACLEEKGVVEEAVKKAVIDRKAANLDDITPEIYIHTKTARIYYTWTGTPPDFIVTPLGTPPC